MLNTVASLGGADIQRSVSFLWDLIKNYYWEMLRDSRIIVEFLH